MNYKKASKKKNKVKRKVIIFQEKVVNGKIEGDKVVYTFFNNHKNFNS